MNSRHFLPILLLALVAVLHRGSVQAEAAVLEDTCKSVADSHLEVSYDYCITSLQADARTRTAPDLSVLAVVAVDLTLANATKTQTKIKSLLEGPSLEPNLGGALKVCEAFYDEMLSLLNSAAKDMAAKAYKEASPKISDSTDKPPNCDNYLFEGGFTEISQENEDCLKLATISELIVASLS